MEEDFLDFVRFGESDEDFRGRFERSSLVDDDELLRRFCSLRGTTGDSLAKVTPGLAAGSGGGGGGGSRKAPRVERLADCTSMPEP